MKVILYSAPDKYSVDERLKFISGMRPKENFGIDKNDISYGRKRKKYSYSLYIISDEQDVIYNIQKIVNDPGFM